jgi:hypothetical protein
MFLASEDIHFRYFRNRHNLPKKHPEISAPNWQRKLLGDQYFLNIKVLGIPGQQAASPDFWMKLRRYLKSLQEVELVVISCQGEKVADESSATLAMMSGLADVYVTDAQVSSAWLSQCAALKNLSSLKIESPSNVPIDFKSLAGLNQANAIVLDHCGLSLDDAEFLRNQLRSTMIIALENNGSNIYD